VFTVEAVEEQYKHIMAGGKEQSVGALKETIKAMIETYERRIQEYDGDLIEQSLNARSSVSLSNDDSTTYVVYNRAITKLKGFLNALRLRGDEFLIIHKGEDKLFKIDTDGQILFCSTKRTTNMQDLVPPDMSIFCYFNVTVVEGVRNSTYEIRSAKLQHYIDDVAKINMENIVVNGTSKGGCCLQWKNGQKSTFVTAMPEEIFELVEVVGAHVKRYNQASLKQIQLLKDIYKCKSTPFNPETPEHVMLLERLWKAMNIRGEFQQVSPLWKTIGFQGINPATDFRAMGLLGLLNLLYFAENHGQKAHAQINSQKEYPWAATGINITHMLLEVLKIDQDLISQHSGAQAWHTPRLSIFYYANDDDTFDEIYSQIFLLFDRLWSHVNAGYMDFPRVIAQVKKSTEGVLERRPTGMNELIGMIEHLQMTYSE